MVLCSVPVVFPDSLLGWGSVVTVMGWFLGVIEGIIGVQEIKFWSWCVIESAISRVLSDTLVYFVSWVPGVGSLVL